MVDTGSQRADRNPNVVPTDEAGNQRASHSFNMIRTYTELSRLDTFEERYHYLALRGVVGVRTFGWERWANQKFYSSYEWKQLRRDVIVRDLGCDLGVEGYDLNDRIIVHHMNPMVAADLRRDDPSNQDMEYLICCSHKTHNAIHYGDEGQLPLLFAERRPGDTTLW